MLIWLFLVLFALEVLIIRALPPFYSNKTKLNHVTPNWALLNLKTPNKLKWLWETYAKGKFSTTIKLPNCLCYAQPQMWLTYALLAVTLIAIALLTVLYREIYCPRYYTLPLYNATCRCDVINNLSLSRSHVTAWYGH